MKKYYHAYEDRYRTAHEKGLMWASDVPTPVVTEVLSRYGISPAHRILDLGCGEGRDALPLLRAGYDLTAADASAEAISFCRRLAPEYADRFKVWDCLADPVPDRYDFIYSMAVLHMLVDDCDRQGFLRFIREHLTPGGLALVTSMGDGEREFATDPRRAFDAVLRDHPSGPISVAATSCRMVSLPTLERELLDAGFSIPELGLTQSPPDFDSLLFAVVRAQKNPSV